MGNNKKSAGRKANMQREPQKLKYEFKRSVCAGLALFLLVVIGAGCATLPPPEQGPYIKIQGGENSGGVTWHK
jgi:hypothetical protein